MDDPPLSLEPLTIEKETRRFFEPSEANEGLTGPERKLHPAPGVSAPLLEACFFWRATCLDPVFYPDSADYFSSQISRVPGHGKLVRAFSRYFYHCFSGPLFLTRGLSLIPAAPHNLSGG